MVTKPFVLMFTVHFFFKSVFIMFTFTSIEIQASIFQSLKKYFERGWIWCEATYTTTYEQLMDELAFLRGVFYNKHCPALVICWRLAKTNRALNYNQ